MKQIIITAKHASSLSAKIEEKQKEGWECVGGHSVVTIHSQNRYAGMQHKDTTYENEYSQSMKKV